MNADGGSFPENMKIFGDMVTHNLTFDPLEGRANLVINSPLPDDWFMLAHTNRRQEDEEMGFVQRVSFKPINILYWQTLIFINRNLIIQYSIMIYRILLRNITCEPLKFCGKSVKG